MKSHAIEKLIATKNKGKVTIRIEDISDIAKYLRNPREIRHNKSKEKNETSGNKTDSQVPQEPLQNETKKYGGVKLKKEKEKEKGLTSKNKLYIGILLGVLFGLIGPIIINELYKPNIYRVSYITLWDTADMLSYYGTLLGAAATIIAVTWTIVTTKKSAEIDRKNQINLNNRSFFIKCAIEFIDSINYRKLTSETYKNTMIKNKELDYNDVALIREEIVSNIVEVSTAYTKFKLFYNSKNDDTFSELDLYKNEYQTDLKELELLFQKLCETTNIGLSCKSREQILGKINEFSNKYCKKYLELLSLIEKVLPDIKC